LASSRARTSSLSPESASARLATRSSSSARALASAIPSLISERFQQIDLVVAEDAALEAVVDDDHPLGLLADAERHRQHRTQLQIDDRAEAREAVVGERVARDDRPPALEHLLHDLPRELLLGHRHRLAREVARHPELEPGGGRPQCQESALGLRQHDGRLHDQSQQCADVALGVDGAVDPLQHQQIVPLARHDADERVLAPRGERVEPPRPRVELAPHVELPHSDPSLADLDPIPFVERGPVDIAAVQARAVGRVVVDHLEILPHALDLGVAPRYLGVAKPDLIVEGAPDPDHREVELHHRAHAILDDGQPKGLGHWWQ
jgi:hypothetical protein